MKKYFDERFILPLVLTCFLASGPEAEMIHLYARKGDVDKVLAEIDKGVDADLYSTRNTTESGVSPLFVAAKFGHAELVGVLIEAGTDFQTFFDAPDGGIPYGTALHAAAAWGQTDVVLTLLRAGANVDPYHPRLGTPLHRALEAGQDDTAAVLVKAGAATRTEIPFDGARVASADLELGREVGIGCGGCHALMKGQADPQGVGPELWNIVGRAKGSVVGFEYSAAMQRDQGNWTYDALNSFIAAPFRYLPGTRMHFSGIQDPERRAALIAWLRTLSDNPAPRP